MFMSLDPTDKPKEGRFARHLRTAAEIRRQPATAVKLSRGWVARLWHAKGGGFYGLGYVVAFLWLEVRSLTGELGESEGVTSFLAGQVFGYLIRFSIESFFNAITAILWPAMLFQSLGVWAIALLIPAWFGFERIVRPNVDAWLPEFRQARLEKAAKQKEDDGS